MCGIAGQMVLAPEVPIEPATLRAAADALRHRGPDDEGLYVGAGVGLAFRRLAILDLDGGHQPMASAEGDVVVVLNGEIYNHKELRRELEARGAHFRTRSDTEVLVHGFRAWGRGLCARLEGMFAFACWDVRAQRLLLARDRMGKKPLFLLEHAGSLWFASEIGALLAVPGWERALDPAALDLYLSQQFIPHPHTIYARVRRLRPAHFLELEGGRREEGEYWRPRFAPKHAGDPRELAEELRALLRDAVRARLESDVPLGAFLSGGVDSSSVVALMAEASTTPVKTYTIGFDDEGFDERPYARAVAQRFATEHHEHLVRPDVAGDLPAILAHYGEPYADKSAVPAWYVAREARRDLTVVLTGDGADDVFAGYGRYVAGPLGRSLARLPRGLRKGWERALLDLLVRENAPSGLRRALGHAARRSALPLLRSLVIPGFFEARDKARLYRPEVAAAVADGGLARLAHELHARTFGLEELVDRMLAVDLDQYLAGDLLPKVDIATMAHSLEARSPFLDRRVVELALSLPTALRVRGGVEKWIVKQAFDPLLPPGIAFRKKHGFSVPVDRWLAGPLAPMLRELLVESPRGVREWFEPAEVRRLVTEHTSGRRRHGGRLWALLCFELWSRAGDGAARHAFRREPESARGGAA